MVRPLVDLMIEARPHPAKFSDSVLREAHKMAERHGLLDTKNVLDPFAGVGRAFEVFPQAVGVEIEPGWARADDRIIVGNTLHLRKVFPRKRFGLIFVSPTYANRMADHHNNQDPCKTCKGEGRLPTSGRGVLAGGWKVCSKCKGTGKSMRHTYRHYYGEDLHPDNSGMLQWGEEYREFHRKAWASVVSVMTDTGYFMLNASDHIRGHKRMPVERFHVKALEELGLTVIDKKRVATPRHKHGKNYEVRVASEGLYLFARSVDHDGRG